MMIKTENVVPRATLLGMLFSFELIRKNKTLFYNK